MSNQDFSLCTDRLRYPDRDWSHQCWLDLSSDRYWWMGRLPVLCRQKVFGWLHQSPTPLPRALQYEKFPHRTASGYASEALRRFVSGLLLFLWVNPSMTLHGPQRPPEGITAKTPDRTSKPEALSRIDQDLPDLPQ